MSGIDPGLFKPIPQEALDKAYAERMFSDHTDLFTENAELQAKLAAAQANTQRLREALWLAHEHARLYIGHYNECQNVYESSKRALAQPDDTTALREFGMKVANLTMKNYHPSGWCMVDYEIVDEVLGEK